MNKFDSSICEASLKTGLSQLQLWILIRNKIIPNNKRVGEARICYSSVRLWMSNNRILSNQLQLDVDHRENERVLTKYIEKVHRRRNNGTR